MTKAKVFRRFLVLCMALCLCISSTAMSAFAMESEPTTVSAEESVEAVTPRVNSFTFYSGGTGHVYLSKLTANSSQKKYTGVGTNGAIVNLRFTNDSTGAVYVLAFRISNKQLIETMGVSVPAGNYTVTQASASARYSYIMINFQ